MKNLPNKSLLLKLCVVLLSGLALIVIHSCRKDAANAGVAAMQITDTEVLAAKSWYESAYPVSAAATEKLRTLGTSNSGRADQFIKPNWLHTAKYKRLNSDVIEMPLDTAGKFNFTLQNATVNKLVALKYTKTSYLVFKTDSGYQAYIMLIIADSAYVNNDFSKLSHNTYRKHDADFTGSVFYFTPKGKIVSSYAYTNGKLVKPGARQSQSTNSVKKVNSQSCFAWFCITYNDSGIVDIEYMYTECDGGLDLPTGGGGGGGGPGDNGCPVTFGANKIQVNSAPPDPDPNDPGFPPPGNTQVNCAVTVDLSVQDIINSVSNICLASIINQLKNSGTLQTDLTDRFRNTFNTSDKINVTFNQGVLTGDHANSDATRTGTIRRVNGAIVGYDLTITFNTPKIANGSQEFLVATTMHEIYHAYLTTQGGKKDELSQHLTMAQNYVEGEVATLRAMFPTLTDFNAKCLILSGYGEIQEDDRPAYDAILAHYNISNNDIVSTVNGYRNGSSGTQCN